MVVLTAHFTPSVLVQVWGTIYFWNGIVTSSWLNSIVCRPTFRWNSMFSVLRTKAESLIVNSRVLSLLLKIFVRVAWIDRTGRSTSTGFEFRYLWAISTRTLMVKSCT